MSGICGSVQETDTNLESRLLEAGVSMSSTAVDKIDDFPISVPERPCRVPARRKPISRAIADADGACFEPHFSVQEVALMWGLSDPKVRELFRGQDGVIEIGSPEKRFKRGYVTLRISESAVRLVYKKLRVS